MNTVRLTQFRTAFARHDWTASERRNYARQWARSLRYLGPKWHLHNPQHPTSKPGAAR